MTFPKAYKVVKPSIVAICTTITTNSYFPDIIGTGFIVDSDGLVMTNQHIIKAIPKLPRLRDVPDDEWPIFCMLFHFIPGKGMAQIPLDVKGVLQIGSYSTPGPSYGSTPDVGFIRVNVTDLPVASLVEKFEMEEGEEVAVSGYPMGTRTLQAPGWIHQVSPTLKIGHISAILPFPCNNPHALLLDSAMQGGNSGSLVFNNEGKVVGLLYGGLEDTFITQNPSDPKTIISYNVPTNLSLAIPSQILHNALETARASKEYKEHKIDTLSLQEILTTHEGVILEPKAPLKTLVPIPEDKIQRLSAKSVSKKKRIGLHAAQICSK